MSAIIAEQKWNWYLLKDNSLDPRDKDFKKQAEVAGFHGANVLRWLESNEYNIVATPQDTEGLVAMLGPVIDTLVVCTCTALVILISGVWQSGDASGATLTAQAFGVLFPKGGSLILAVLVSVLSLSTVFTFWYYGSKCLGFIIGARYQHHYIWFYFVLVIVGALASLNLVVNLIDSMYALMAIPTMLSTLLLAPKVNAAAKVYFSKP